MSDQQVTTDEDVQVSIDGLARATGLGSGKLIVSSPSAPGHQAAVADGRHILVTPMKDFSGSFTVTYLVKQGSQSTTARATVTVRPVNDPPVAVGRTIDVHGSISITLDGNDVDGDVLAYEVLNGPLIGTLSGTPPVLVYTPPPGFSGIETINYVVRDRTTSSAQATLRLQVSIGPVPIAFPDAVVGVEDQAFDLQLHASDENSDPLTYTIVRPPAHGALSGTPPNLTYTPEPNFAGSDSLLFFVSDGAFSSNTAMVTIGVQAINDPPRGDAQDVTLNEDASRAITLTASDPDDNFLSFSVQTVPSHGTLSGFAPNLTYVPAPNYHGADSFSFRVSDFNRESVATVTIDVASIEDPPLAGSLSRTLSEDTPTAITLSGNDGDGDPISFAVVTDPGHGTLSGTVPALTYTPAANYNGPDTFTYTVSSGGVTSAPATVTLTVSAVNDVPVATGDAVTTVEDNPIAITLQATDVETPSLTFTIVTPPVGGTLTGSGASWTYTPALNATGSRSFVFRASDGVASATAVITIEITPVNDPPTTFDDFAATDPGTPLTLGVTGNDLDPENDSFSVDSVEAPAHGDIDIVNGALLYTPDAGFTGVDDVAYVVIDSQGASATGHAHIGVGMFPRGAPKETLAAIGGPVATDSQRPAAISSDGRYIAFASVLPLVAGDANGQQDIHLYDRGRRVLTRISQTPAGADGNGASLRPHLSGDGRYVVFDSTANNLVAGDSNAVADVFRHDRVTGETVRISVATGGGQASGSSIDAEISEDGNVVAFTSAAFDLIGSDANGATDIFVRDVAAGTTVRISVGPTGGEADLASSAPALSGNGRYVAFSSLATNLVVGDSNGVSDVFLRDRIAGTTTRISVSSTGVEANSRSSGPSLSHDGRFVSFLSDATNLVPGITAIGQLYVRDLRELTTTHPLTNDQVVWARLSGDGRYVTAYRPFIGVVIRDRFVGVNAAPAGASAWLWPMISADGSYVVVLDTVSGGSVTVVPNPL